MYTIKSGLFLLGSCVAAIAAVGSMFELGYGDPDLGTLPTSLILGFSLPMGIFLFVAAVRDVKANQ